MAFREYVSIRKALRAQQDAHESRRSFAVITRNTFFIEIDACKNPRFLVDVFRNRHFGASTHVHMLCLVCTLVLSVLNVA